jgi:hypothetical protein
LINDVRVSIASDDDARHIQRGQQNSTRDTVTSTIRNVAAPVNGLQESLVREVLDAEASGRTIVKFLTGSRGSNDEARDTPVQLQARLMTRRGSQIKSACELRSNTTATLRRTNSTGRFGHLHVSKRTDERRNRQETGIKHEV